MDVRAVFTVSEGLSHEALLASDDCRGIVMS